MKGRTEQDAGGDGGEIESGGQEEGEDCNAIGCRGGVKLEPLAVQE